MTLNNPANPTAFLKLGINIAHETFEDELVVVNMESGKYYAMSGEAADILNLCTQNATETEIVSIMESCYSCQDHFLIASSISNYLDQLKKEGIIVETDSRPESQELPSLVRETKTLFNAPNFEVHNDMQDLLVLDPIHEVDDAGWPSLKPPKE